MVLMSPYISIEKKETCASCEICIYLKPNIYKSITVVDWPNYEDGVTSNLIMFSLVQFRTFTSLVPTVKPSFFRGVLIFTYFAENENSAKIRNRKNKNWQTLFRKSYQYIFSLLSCFCYDTYVVHDEIPIVYLISNESHLISALATNYYSFEVISFNYF